MVRQNHEGVDVEMVAVPRLSRGLSKRLDVFSEKPIASGREQIDREEPAPPGGQTRDDSSACLIG